MTWKLKIEIDVGIFFGDELKLFFGKCDNQQNRNCQSMLQSSIILCKHVNK